MVCPACKQSIPANAQFCIYCAAQVEQEVPADIVVDDVTPATGPTRRLTPAASIPAPVAAPIPAPRRVARQNQGRRPGKDLGGKVFWIGMIILLVTGRWWPGILLVLGITAFANAMAQGRPRDGLQNLLIFGAIALLFGGSWLWHGVWMFWPVLVVFGLVRMFGGHGCRQRWRP